MSDNRPARRFLMETCSQHFHRMENIRRRRELLERASAKPPVMRFGSIDKSSRSVSPQPRAVLAASARKQQSQSPQPFKIASRSRQSSCEQNRLPHSASDTKSHPPLCISSLSRSKSCQSGLAVSRRVSSSVPTGQGQAQRGANVRQALQKRSRSTSQAKLCTKLLRVDKPGENCQSGKSERTVPFMCYGSPTRNGSLSSKKSISRTPTPPPLSSSSQHPTHGEDVKRNIDENLPTVLRAEEKVDAKTSTMMSPFTLPSVAKDQRQNEQKEGITVKSEENEEAVMVRVSEFRLPRTPQRRSSGVMSCHTQKQPSITPAKNNTSNGSEDKKEEKDKNTFEKMQDTSYCTNCTDFDVCDKEEKQVELSIYSEKDKTFSPVSSCTLGSLDIKADGAHNVSTATPIPSFPAYECSSTTAESSENISNKEADETENDCEIRQLSFDSYADHEKDKIKAANSVACTAQEVVTTFSSYGENDIYSQRFFECVSAPLTPELQLPETFKLLEATRVELAASSSNYQRVPTRRVAERRDVEGRGSLVLATGEPPVVHTPAIQEPRSPPPSDMPKRHSPSPNLSLKNAGSRDLISSPAKNVMTATYFGGSPIPLPVTLRSKLGSPHTAPFSAEKKTAFFSQDRAENCGVQRNTVTLITETTTLGRKGLCVGGNIERSCERPDGEGNIETTPHSNSDIRVDCRSPGARGKMEHIIAAEQTPQTPSQRRGSAHLSEVLTDASFTSQRNALCEQKNYYDYTYWETYLRDVTKRSAQKRRRKATKRAKKAVNCSVTEISKTQGAENGVDMRRKLVHDVGPEVTAKSTTAGEPKATSARMPLDTSANLSRLQSRSARINKKFSLLFKNLISRKNRQRIMCRKRFVTQRQNEKPQ